MRVMVTGGTGFIGGHVVAALLAAGHEPHLLVRDADKVKLLCQLHELDPAAVSMCVGDILDRTSVEDALTGCGACVHAAAFTSLDPAEMPRALDVNAPGTRTVLDAALAAGCDPVIHLSSISVIFPPTGEMMSAADRVETGGAPYPASKAESDLYARDRQAGGEPVVILYPTAVLGPRDLGVNVLESMMPAIVGAPAVLRGPTGGWLMLDVRDLAFAVAALVVPGRGPRRYVIGGRFMSYEEFGQALEQVTGVARPVVDLSEEELAGAMGEEAAKMMVGMRPADDGPIVGDTGVTWRPFAESLSDLLAWMASRQAQ